MVVLFGPFVPIGPLSPDVDQLRETKSPQPGWLKQLIDLAIKMGPESRALGLEFMNKKSEVCLSITRLPH